MPTRRKLAVALISLFAAACGGTSTSIGGGAPACAGFAYIHPFANLEVGRSLGSPNSQSNTVSKTLPQGCTSLTGFSIASATAGGTAFPPGLTFNTVNGTISGTPAAVSPPAFYVVTATGNDGVVVSSRILRIAVYPKPAASYAISPAHGLSARALDFYDAARNWPVNQSDWGFCEVASTSGLLSYALHGNTNQVSPLFTLFHAYDVADTHPEFFPAPTAPHTSNFYFWYTPNISTLWDFIKTYGFVRFQDGVTPDTLPQTVFVEFATAAKQVVNDKTTYPPQNLPGTEPWDTVKADYEQQLGAPDTALETDLYDMASWRTVVQTTFEGATLSAKIADALDKGNLVQFMWRVLDFNVASEDAESYFYAYDADGLSGTTPVPATCGTTQAAACNNTYSLGRPSSIGGDHWVYVFAYATATDGSGQKMFLFRNSWGPQGNPANRENGNYYMADSYIDGWYPKLDANGYQEYSPTTSEPLSVSLVQSIFAFQIGGLTR
jgi:hypothetical protein